MTDFRSRVYEAVTRIPMGRVCSYGDVAALLGRPRAARGVGAALSALDETEEIPWWRVVNRNGEISISHLSLSRRLQRVLLEREGVEFDPRGRIDMERFGWDGAEAPVPVPPTDLPERD
jgi:methylated-DNA-protein-cysteine methyltransferase-like protein